MLLLHYWLVDLSHQLTVLRHFLHFLLALLILVFSPPFEFQILFYYFFSENTLLSPLVVFLVVIQVGSFGWLLHVTHHLHFSLLLVIFLLVVQNVLSVDAKVPFLLQLFLPFSQMLVVLLFFLDFRIILLTSGLIFLLTLVLLGEGIVILRLLLILQLFLLVLYLLLF